MNPRTVSSRARLSIALAALFVFDAAPLSSGSAETIREAVARLIAESGAKEVAVVFLDSSTGADVQIQADTVFHAASTMKVPVMMEVYRQAHSGTLSLDDRLSLRNDFPSIADGSPYALDPKDDSELTLYKRIGDQESIRELTRLMITESSNLATNLLIERVSARRVSGFMNELGDPSLRVLRGVEDGAAYRRGLNNTVTARGLAHVLRLMIEGKAVSPQSSSAMLDVLKGQKFHEGIPAGLPSGTVVAHKTGWIQGLYYHDAAVVYPPERKPYVLVVLTRGIKDDAKAYRLVAEISRSVYDHVTRK